MELAGFGAAAIEPLRQFLLQGAPTGIFQARQWAVEALAALGAKDALVEYLAPASPWRLKQEAAERLDALYTYAETLIENEIERRNQEPPLKRATGDALIALIRLRRRVRNRA